LTYVIQAVILRENTKGGKDMTRGWWKIEYEAVDEGFVEPNEVDLEHIAEMIKEGYTSGEIIQEEEPETSSEE